MADFESKSVSVATLFSHQSFFRIPEYQRPFSWDDENFDDLISDTRDADRSAHYFMGTMVLHRETDGTLSVVDGQQRITSLLILLACLRDAVEDAEYKGGIQEKILQQAKVIEGIPERIRLEVKERAIFHSIVVIISGTLSKYDLNDLSTSQRRYVRAAEIFHQRISSLTQAEIKDLITFIFQKCTVIYLLADSFEEAFRLFEIVNDRGKQLRRIDILKSMNIAPSVVTQDTVRSRIAQRWEELESEVGESVFESVFFLVRLILLRDKPKGDLLKEFQDRIFAKSLVSRGEPFADLIFEYTRLYVDIFIDKTYIGGDDKYGIRYQSLIHVMDSEFQASEWRACLLFFAKKFGRDDFYKFCLAVEKMFATQWVQGVRKDERYADYAKLLSKIESEKSASAVISAVPFDEKAIISAVTRNDIYGAGFCKYALLRLELVTSEHDVPKRFSARSIEHVFPQNPSDGSGWLNGVERSDVSKFVHSIGNLVLISKSRNSSVGNMEFEEKKKKYLKTRVSDYPRSVQVLGYTEWTRDIIAARTLEVEKIFLEEL